MTVLDATVTKILGEPEFKHGKWFVKVERDCWGAKDEAELMFSTEASAKAVEVGYKFHC